MSGELRASTLLVELGLHFPACPGAAPALPEVGVAASGPGAAARGWRSDETCSFRRVTCSRKDTISLKYFSSSHFLLACSMAVAWKRATLFGNMWLRSAAFTRQAAVQNGAVHCARHKYSLVPEDYNCKVDLALTSDRRTIVCHHPSVEIPYEHTEPVPRPDPVNNKEETLDQVLKSRLEVKEMKNDKGPTIEELSKMFYTTKHRWYPVGQYHRRRKNYNFPKER
ncbi:39S ribosomal protein L42, mitochondrial [Alligator mississippiensis]|uniref:Large ribosomal subunit protein mL42 n=1 Tax=Alligator mississippiensis TaxID=8496 RepID=A0A151LYV6_ALLMI|nr:39S ribosomal protein L42, mitochondrial [Alligator mississippiensis]